MSLLEQVYYNCEEISLHTKALVFFQVMSPACDQQIASTQTFFQVRSRSSASSGSSLSRQFYCPRSETFAKIEFGLSPVSFTAMF